MGETNRNDNSVPAAPPVEDEQPEPEPTEEQTRAVEHANMLLKWVVNCIAENEEPYSQMSCVTDPTQVYQPLIPVGTETEYRGVNINKLSTESMIASLRGFFSYKRPGFSTNLEHPPGWVLFEHGTYVIIPEPGPGPVADYKTEAISFMNRFGQVLMGCNAADITMFKVRPDIHNGVAGWVVFSEFPMLGTFVGANELEGHENHENANQMLVGYYGREKRHLDATQLVIVHEERGGPAIADNVHNSNNA